MVGLRDRDRPAFVSEIIRVFKFGAACNAAGKCGIKISHATCLLSRIQTEIEIMPPVRRLRRSPRIREAFLRFSSMAAPAPALHPGGRKGRSIPLAPPPFSKLLTRSEVQNVRVREGPWPLTLAATLRSPIPRLQRTLCTKPHHMIQSSGNLILTLLNNSLSGSGIMKRIEQFFSMRRCKGLALEPQQQRRSVSGETRKISKLRSPKPFLRKMLHMVPCMLPSQISSQQR